METYLREKVLRWFLLIATVCLLCSCSRTLLSVRSESLRPSYLASEHINTPDPLRSCYFGQQILVFWKLPKECTLQNKYLVLKLRYQDRTLEEVVYPITKTQGCWIYRRVNENYWNHGEALAYQVELYDDDLLVERWNHHLWVDILNL